MNIILDTNVLVSALLNPHGNFAKILNMIINNTVILLYDNRILDEYRNVLRRDKFGFDEEIIEPLIDYIASEGIFITADPIKDKLIDDNDRMFMEVFLSGKADYLITGNKKHFKIVSNVIDPKEFLEIIEK